MKSVKFKLFICNKVQLKHWIEYAELMNKSAYKIKVIHFYMYINIYLLTLYL